MFLTYERFVFGMKGKNVRLRSSPMLWNYLRHKFQNFIKTGSKSSFYSNDLNNT